MKCRNNRDIFMLVNPINNNQNFAGKVIVKNRISVQQNYLFSLHKPALEKMIEDMPFDLFVEQSKSRKTIKLSTNVKDADSYVVRKNKQDFETAAGYAIEDAKQKSPEYKMQMKGREILDVAKSRFQSLLDGKFNEVRNLDKKLAVLGTENFKVYKGVTNYRLTGFPKDVNKTLLKNIFKYKFYELFTPKTKEEKQLRKMNKEYAREMKAKGIKPKPPQIIDFSQLPGYRFYV